MSNDKWAFFEPFVITKSAQSGRRPRDHRLVLDGVFWIARTGVQWRDLPEFFGKWSTVYRQFRRWTLAGVWDILLEALNDTEEVGETVQMIDSTVIRAHQWVRPARSPRNSAGSGVLTPTTRVAAFEGMAIIRVLKLLTSCAQLGSISSMGTSRSKRA